MYISLSLCTLSPRPFSLLTVLCVVMCFVCLLMAVLHAFFSAAQSYSVRLEEWDGKNWVPFKADDVQLEFVRLDPYIRVNLKVRLP